MCARPTETSALADGLLEGRCAWITGGGSGLGRAMAMEFARLGARVGVSGRREEPLRQTVAAIEAAGGSAAFASCDVREPADVETAFASLQERLGGIDVLVNNAAGNFLSPSEALSPNGFAAVVGIVLNGTFHCTSVAARHWIPARIHGTVLNIATTYATTGSAFVLPSACAKAGVVAMTRSLAVEWGRHGIRVNAIAPGPIPTEGAFSRLLPSEQLVAERTSKIPAGRMGTPRELAQLAAFLVSDAADWIRGEVLTFDGGEWLRGAGEFNWMLEVEIPWDEMRRRGRREEKT